jgi:hypothetical protein
MKAVLTRTVRFPRDLTQDEMDAIYRAGPREQREIIERLGGVDSGWNRPTEQLPEPKEELK